MATVYISKEDVDHIVLNNNTGADLAQYEFTVIGELCLIADDAIVDGETGSFHAGTTLIIQTDDLETGEDTFATVNQDVYWNPTSGDFSDTETDTYYKVGTLKTIKDTNGMIVFVKDLGTRLDAILRAEPRILVVEVEASYATATAIVGLSEGDKIIGMSSICNVSEASGTIQLLHGTANAAISDALQQVTANEVAYAATLDVTYTTLPASGAKLVATGTDEKDVRCTVVITYIPA